MSQINSYEETKTITDAVFEGYTGDFETGMKINARTREKIKSLKLLII